MKITVLSTKHGCPTAQLSTRKHGSYLLLGHKAQVELRASEDLIHSTHHFLYVEGSLPSVMGQENFRSVVLSLSNAAAL